MENKEWRYAWRNEIKESMINRSMIASFFSFSWAAMILFSILRAISTLLLLLVFTVLILLMMILASAPLMAVFLKINPSFVWVLLSWPIALLSIFTISSFTVVFMLFLFLFFVTILAYSFFFPLSFFILILLSLCNNRNNFLNFFGLDFHWCFNNNRSWRSYNNRLRNLFFFFFFFFLFLFLFLFLFFLFLWFILSKSLINYLQAYL